MIYYDRGTLCTAFSYETATGDWWKSIGVFLSPREEAKPKRTSELNELKLFWFNSSKLPEFWLAIFLISNILGSNLQNNN